MFKWIFAVFLIYTWIAIIFAYNSSYTPISKQIDLKTMSLKKPDFIVLTRSNCVWDCRNYSDSSSYWWWSYGWK